MFARPTRPSCRIRAPFPLRCVELERRDLPSGGPLGALQPPALPFNYATTSSGLPLLHSLPTARAAVFLDFDGHGSNTSYDTDGSPATFGAAERAVIVEAWRHISVYFAFFDVDVTTEQPPPSRPTAWQVITNSISRGFAFVGAFPNSAPEGFNPSGDARTRQSGIAHEVGHNLGLRHQSDYDLLGVQIDDYSNGYDALHGPIMGADFDQDVHKWFIGHPSNSPSTVQDDIAVMANRIRSAPTPLGDGFRPDDHADTAVAGTPLELIDGLPYGWGVIERIPDVDAFSFTVPDGRYTVAAIPNVPSGVDLKMEVAAADGSLLALADGPTNDQQVTLTLPAGTYTALLSSHGDYGDLGAYFLSVRPLEAGWDTRNVGRTIDGGYAGFDPATGTYDVGGSGVDGNTADAFRFVYTPLTGNGTIVARVTSVENTSSGAKAGVMVRETLDAGSRYASMAVAPGGGGVFRRRTATDGGSVTTTTSGPAVPYWVRLVRSGNTLTGSTSADGVTWSQVSSTTISMASTVYIGLTVSAGTSSQANNLADAAFSNVTVTGSTGTPPPVYNTLPAPSGLTLSHGAGTAIDVSWTGVEGAAAYTVERSPDAVDWSAIATVSASTYSDANPGRSQRDFYRVSSRDESGHSVPSAMQGLVNRPGAPSNFTVSSWRTDRLILNWRDVSGDTGYRVERSTDSTTWTTVATVGTNVPSYTNTGLTTATQYVYRIVPLSPYGDGPVSTAYTTSTRLDAVIGLSVTGVAANRIDLQWDALPAATSYRVQRSTDGQTFSSVGTVTTRSYADTSVAPLSQYHYRVIGVNALTESISASATVSATTPATNPPRVQNVRVNDGSAQRSRVTNLTVTFSAVVTLPANPADAFRLLRVDGQVIGLSADASVVGGVTQVVLTFTGDGTESGSLADGNYTLTILSPLVSTSGGQLDGDGNGTAEDHTTTLYRLFGDATGDRFVNAADLSEFRGVFGTSGSDLAFDFNGDGFINAADLNAFRSRFGAGV